MKQKRILLKWASLSLGSLILAFVFTLNSVCFAKGLVIENFTPPKKEEVIWMDSVSVNNLQINFLKDSRVGKLVGRTFGESVFSNVGEVVYTIKSPSGAVFWEKSQKDNILFDGNKVILFNISLEGVRLPKDSKLIINVFNKKNKLIANGESIVASQIFFSDPELSDLRVDVTKKQGIVSFLLNNPSDEVVSVWPKVEVYNREETELISASAGDFIGIGSRTKQQFEMEFELPAVPQVYVLRVSATTKDGIEVGGSLKKNFLIKGFFAQIQSIELLDTDVIADTATFVFTGVVKPNTKLDVAIKMIQEFEGSVVEKYEKVLSIESNKKGRFKGNVAFKLEENADYFIVDILVKYKDIIIGKKHMEKKIIIAPKLEEAIEQQQKDKELEENIEKVKWWLRKDLLVWGIVLFILSLFSINNWSRLHKKLLLMFISAIFCSQMAMGYGGADGTPASTAWWRHPVIEWYYNPSPDNTAIPTAGFENFSKMRMNGEILNALDLDTDPLFGSPAPNTKPTPIVLINFKKGATYDGWFAIDPGDSSGAQDFDPDSSQFDFLSVDRSVEFAFEIDIQDVTNQRSDDSAPHETLKHFLGQEDGEWEYTVYFCMEGMDTSCSGGQWYATTARSLHIDSAPPTMNLEHDSSSTLSLHNTQLGTLKTDLATNILNRDNNLQIKITKQIIKNSKIEDKVYKIGERGEKTRQRSDVIRQIVIINNRLDKIAQDLSPDNDSYLTTTEKSNLEAEQANLNALLTSKEILRDSLRTEIEGATDTGDLSGTGGLNGEVTALEAEIATLDTEITAAQNQVNTLDPVILGLKNSIKTIKQTSKTDPVTLDLECDDGTGSDCQSTTYHIETRGNFCDNPDICDTTATRQFKLCDRVGNCEDSHSNEIDWYDPVIPETIVTFRNDSTEDGTLDSNFTGSEIKAGNIMSFKLSDTATTDYRRKDTSTVGATLSFNYNENACGANANVPFYEDTTNNICLERVSSCANSAIDRGEKAIDTGGACNSLCDAGYIYHDGICYPDCDQRNLSICLPGILGRGDCALVDFNDWSPDPSTVQNGVTFTQENKCGNRREFIGTANGVCPNINVFGCAPFSGIASFQ